MSDETKDKSPIDLDLEFANLGGTKVGHWAPSENEIDFSAIQGVRTVLPPPTRAAKKLSESVE
jgi:hypothetical protein